LKAMKREWLRPLEQSLRHGHGGTTNVLNESATPKHRQAGEIGETVASNNSNTAGHLKANRPPSEGASRGGDVAAGDGAMLVWQKQMTEDIGKVLTRMDETTIEVISVRQQMVRMEGLLEDCWRVQGDSLQKSQQQQQQQQQESHTVANFGSTHVSEAKRTQDPWNAMNSSVDIASELQAVRQQIDRVETLLSDKEKQHSETVTDSEAVMRLEGQISPELADRMDATLQAKLDELHRLHVERLDDLMNFCIQNKENELSMRDLYVSCQEAVQRLKDWSNSEEALQNKVGKAQELPTQKEAPFPASTPFPAINRHSTDSSLTVLESRHEPEKPPDQNRALRDIEEDEDERTGNERNPAVRLCSLYLSWVSLVLVVLNVIFMTVKLSLDMPNAMTGDATPSGLMAGEYAFTVAFVIELLMKLSLEKRLFFVGKHSGWNMFDSILVILQMFETVHGMGNHTIMRLAVLGKVVRITRLLRLMRNLRLFRMMAATGQWQVMFWASVAIFTTVFMFALLATQVVETGMRYKIKTGETVPKEAMQYFGSVGQSMLTLFMATTGGMPWKESLEALDTVGQGYSETLFLVYIFVMTFTVMNTINAAYVDTFIHCSELIRFVALSEAKIRDQHKYDTLTQIFEAADLNANGKIRYEGFSAAIHDPHAQEVLASLHLEPHSVMALFRTLEDAEDAKCVEIEEFMRSLAALQEGSINILLMSTLVSRGQSVNRSMNANGRMMQKHFLKVEHGIDKVECENLELLMAARNQAHHADHLM